MQIFEQNAFGNIKGFKLGWSPLGPPLMTVYCYLLGDAMVDTGQAHMAAAVVKIIADHTVRRIYLTHHHEDHSGNAAVLKRALQARIFGHPLTKAKLIAPFRILLYQKYIWGQAMPLDIDTLPTCIETDLGPMVPVHTPGHSKDHTVFFLKNAGVLFSGDLYLADRIKFFRKDEDVGLQITSLRTVLKLDFDTLLCSHFPKLSGGKQRIQKKLAFLQNLYGRTIEFWKQGHPEKQILHDLKLKEDYFIKYFCFGNVSMLNGVRSIVRHYENKKAASISGGDQPQIT